MAVNLIGPAGVNQQVLLLYGSVSSAVINFILTEKFSQDPGPGGVHRSAWHFALSLHNSGCILVDSLAAQESCLTAISSRYNFRVDLFTALGS